MPASDLVSELRQRTVVERPLVDLDALIASARLIRDHDTKLAGHLRILELEGEIVFQEEHPDRRLLLLRRLASLEDAEALAAARLQTYERMWDGCGCKVDYYR